MSEGTFGCCFLWQGDLERYTAHRGVLRMAAQHLKPRRYDRRLQPLVHYFFIPFGTVHPRQQRFLPSSPLEASHPRFSISSPQRKKAEISQEYHRITTRLAPHNLSRPEPHFHSHHMIPRQYQPQRNLALLLPPPFLLPNPRQRPNLRRSLARSPRSFTPSLCRLLTITTTPRTARRPTPARRRPGSNTSTQSG